MRRIGLAVVLALSLLAPLVAVAQPIPKVGFIEAGSPSVNRHFADAFRRGLKEFGYVEGHTIAIEERWAEGRIERFPDLVAELLRLTAVYGFGEFARAGGLLAYGPSVTDMFYRAAAFVDRILRGAKAADLPVEQPTRFELVVNLKTAKTLGITIPQSILVRADEVIQ